jgi:hypothetical protein
MLHSDRKAILYLFLLAIQFGVQPSLTRRYTPCGIIRSTVLLIQEIIKFFIAFLMLKLSGSFREAIKGELQKRNIDSHTPNIHKIQPSKYTF